MHKDTEKLHRAVTVALIELFMRCMRIPNSWNLSDRSALGYQGCLPGILGFACYSSDEYRVQGVVLWGHSAVFQVVGSPAARPTEIRVAG